MGHLVRLLAIARRCIAQLRPVFVSMSQALRIAREFGYPAEYIPFHTYLGASPEGWNVELRLDLNELLEFYDPYIIVFDGNTAYQGLVDTIRDHPHRTFVWCRRAMWPPSKTDKHIVNEKYFDAVVEPGELASRYDFGITTKYRGRTRQVSPITLFSPDELLTRDLACEALGLNPGGQYVLLQLGAGNNFSYSDFMKVAIDLLAKSRMSPVVARSLISNGLTSFSSDVKTIEVFPLARQLRAFDLVISASGYNSFHELVRYAVPSIFVPNENPDMDNQLARARFAEKHRLGACVRRSEIYNLRDAIEYTMDATFTDGLPERCSRSMGDSDGAREAAQIIEEFYYSAVARR